MPQPPREPSTRPDRPDGGTGRDDATDPRLLLLSPGDNVYVLRAPLQAGERIAVEGAGIEVATTLGLGHKIARRPIAAGETVVKYGAPIGVTTAPIRTGDHVHIQNLRSTYTPTYSLPQPQSGGER
jgi:hypothetical protein